jgi:hypothetical protein
MTVADYHPEPAPNRRRCPAEAATARNWACVGPRNEQNPFHWQQPCPQSLTDSNVKASLPANNSPLT